MLLCGHLPIEMKRRFPELPIICDPSHICGKRDNLLEVAQASVNLDYNGLIIESHIQPDKAWSDAKQQITPEELDNLLNKVVWRSEDVSSPDYHQALDHLRQQIDHCDDELIQILSHRMIISEKIGDYKRDNNITILQTNRWNDLLQKVIEKGEKKKLSKEFIIKLFDAIHLESINHQK